MRSFRDLYRSGELRDRVREAYRHLGSCDLCPHCCGVNRLRGERGRCRAGFLPRVASATIHRGEEPPVSGSRGSGTIFFSGCTLSCLFCQNYPISHLDHGDDIPVRALAERMLHLAGRGAHNINLVTPTHFLPQILAALFLAIPRGFDLPVVWNSSGYERPEILALLEGVVSVYLPDMKYGDDPPALRLSGAPGYREVNRRAVLEMFRQVGHLETDREGIAVSGLIIRHLVLPEGGGGTREILSWVRDHLGEETHVSLMSQYFPAGRAAELHGMDRGVTPREYDAALSFLQEYGLENGWIQELEEERKGI
ncbi:MAG: radical SAM protein [Desulfuromonadia bacterium]